MLNPTQEHLETSYTKTVELDYLLYLPENPEGPSPLLLYLHGMGERGEDLSQVEVNGLPNILESKRAQDLIIVAPLCPADTIWQVSSLVSLLDDLTEKLNVDTQRVYVTGLSMGGTGTWALADAFPDRFAAIAPICGPFTVVDPQNFKRTPTWCFHGAMDDVVPVSDSSRMVKWLRDAGADVRFTVYPDADHNSWTQAYQEEELYDWMLKQRKE